MGSTVLREKDNGHRWGGGEGGPGGKKNFPEPHWTAQKGKYPTKINEIRGRASLDYRRAQKKKKKKKKKKRASS